MYNTQFHIYRLVRDTTAKETRYETTSSAMVDAYVEPAGLSAVAPIEASIGQPFTMYIKSLVSVDIRDGFKMVNVADETEYYFVTSVIEAFRFEAYDYQLSAYKPKQAQIEV